MNPQSLSVAVVDGDPQHGPALMAVLHQLNHRPRLFDAPPARLAGDEVYFDALIAAWRGDETEAVVAGLAERFRDAYVILAVPPEVMPRAAELLGRGVDRYALYPYAPVEIESILRRVILRRRRVHNPLSMEVDTTGRVIYASRQAEALLHYAPGTLVGMSVEAVYQDGLEEARRVGNAIRQSKEHRVDAYPTALRTREGAPIAILLSAEARFDENNQYASSVGFFTLERNLAQRIARRLREAAAGDDYTPIARILAEEMRAEACLLLRYDHQTDRLAAVGGAGLLPGGPAEAFAVDGPLGRAFEAGKPQRDRDGPLVAALAGLGPCSRHGRVAHVLAAPLIDKTPAGDQPIGLLLLLNKQWGEGAELDREGFSWTDESFAGLLAEEMADLMQYRFHGRVFEALLAVENALGGDRDQLLQRIVSTLTEEIGYRTAYIRLLRPDNSLRIWASAGVRQEFLVPDMGNPDEPASFQATPQGQGIVGQAIGSDGPVAVRDVQSDERFHYKELAHAAGWRGMLAVPIRLQGRPIGVLVCYTGRPHYFSGNELALATAFAHLAGHIVSTSIMSISRGEELSLMHGLLRLAAGEKDEQKLWGNVLKQVQELFGAPYGSISRIDRAAGVVRTIVGHGFPAAALEKPRPIGGPSVLGWVASHGQPALIKDIDHDPRWQGIYEAAQPHTRAELAVPIFRGQDPTYIINLESDQPSAFGAEHLLRLEALNILPHIVDQNEVLRAPYRRQDMRRNATRTAIKRIIHDVKQWDPGEVDVLGAILEAAVGVVGANVGSVHMIDDTGNFLELKAAFPPERYEMVQRVAGRLKLRDPGQVGFVQGERRGIVVRAIELNVAQLVADVTSDRDYLQVDPRSGSALAVYLGDGERLLGTLYVEHEERGYLKEVHRDTLIALADLAVVALHIPDQARRMAEVMTEMAELRRLGYFKSIESIWLHTAKGLIGAARANIENYQLSGDSTDLERAAARLVRLNEEISLNTDWGLRVKTKESLDRVLANLVATWQSNFTDVEFVYDNQLTRNVALRLDWLTFRQALSQLVANAETAFPRRPTEGRKYRGTIALTVAGVGDNIVLTLDDDGPGIPRALLGRLGRVLNTEKSRRQNGGWGTFAVAYYFRQKFDGTVTWENRRRGARVTITIPHPSGSGPGHLRRQP